MDDADLAGLRIPRALDDSAREILAITDELCLACLDHEYAALWRSLVARLARKRPSPLVRGDARIWAAGSTCGVGRQDSSSTAPNTRASPRTSWLRGSASSRRRWPTRPRSSTRCWTSARSSRISPAPTCSSLLAWLVSVGGIVVDARMLPDELQDEGRRRGLIPDLAARRAV
jgi:hypothetical protein